MNRFARITIQVLLTLSLLNASSCVAIRFLEERMAKSSGVKLPPLFLLPGAGQNPSFPSAPGQTPGPEGKDLLSSTTNHSSKVEDPSSQANGLAGAGFIAPPAPNNMGTVSLGYPLEIPAGRAGVSPSVGLSYSSNGGDGWIGIGWSLGLGGIARTVRNGQLYYDSRDEFTYNGKRLLKVSGSASNENGIYRLEIESGFQKFELSNIENGGVWKIQDAGGNVADFGLDQDSRIGHPENQKLTYAWYFSRREDRNGNYMTALYDTDFYQDKHVLYLKEIRYTGNSKTNQSPRQYVRFHLKARKDFYVSTAPGFIMRMDKLLARIEVGWDQGVLWEYKLVYESSPDSHRPLLKTVESNRTTTKPEFFYQAAERSFSWMKSKNLFADEPETNPANTKYFEGDFNGDGISDMVFFNPVTGFWKAAESRRGGGFNFKTYAKGYKDYDSPAKIQFFKSNVSGDYNGDGRADIAFYLPETREFVVAEHNGRIFQFRSYGRSLDGLPDLFKTEWFPGDFDGNGLSDMLLFDEPTGRWILMSNVGRQFSFRTIGTKFQNLFRNDFQPGNDLNSPNTRDRSLSGAHRDKIIFTAGDYNGDGRSDTAFYDKRSGKFYVGEQIRNSEGNFAINWKLYRIFSAPEKALFGQDRFSGDFNGDGFSDFLIFNRDNGEWILGETGKDSINFRIYSRTSQFKDITRWLQGDFNGDGRTDIGFYSDKDKNFWIGEATPDGFRYRVYNNMHSGPDKTRVMNTKLPEDEVRLLSDEKLLNLDSGKSLLLSYQFDANSGENKGEQAFAGCFFGNDCSTAPEILFYDRALNQFSLQRENNSPQTVLENLDLEKDSISLLNGERPGRFTQRSKDELLLYAKTSAFANPDTHTFSVLKSGTGDSLLQQTLGEFTSDDVKNFDIQESFYLIDYFTEGDSKSILTLNDQTETAVDARFILRDTDGVKKLLIAGDLEAENFNHIFRQGTGSADRRARTEWSFFSIPPASGETARRLVLVDRRESTHKWYIGRISLGAIGTDAGVMEFSRISTGEKFQLASENYDNAYGAAGVFHFKRERSGTESLIYPLQNDSNLFFYELQVDINGVTQTRHSPGAGYLFRNEYNFENNPILYGPAGRVIYNLTEKRIETLDNKTHIPFSLTRPQLMEKIYPFRWIQGDFNGDSKTDIGIIHLKESEWYFALTKSTVPDILNKLYNGIGGVYKMEYVNSTSFDNTGDDDISDLPTNYKVISKLIREDGLGRYIESYYDYKGGFAWSDFINGRREVDYFGFSEFTVRDAFGSRDIKYYHTTPYDDFRQNRALAGALKESLYIGRDNKQYSRTLYDYSLHEITQGGIQTSSSYLVVPSRIRKYVENVLTQTREVSLTLAPGRYELNNRSSSMTDHYSDSAHPSETIHSFSQYQTIAASNQQQQTLSRSFSGSALETTSSYTYDGLGNQIRKSVAYTGTGLSAVQPGTLEYDYNAYGLLSEERNVSASPARIARYKYDTELNQFLTESESVGDTIDLVSRSIINYGVAFGIAEQTIDPDGNKTYLDFDAFGRVIRVRADTDQGVQTLQDYSYNTSFPLSAKTVFYTGTNDPETSFRTYWDGLSRPLHTVRSAANGRYVRSGTVFYDILGRVARVSQPEWAEPGEMDRFVFHRNEKNPTLTEYDDSGRVNRVTYPQAEGESEATYVLTKYNDPWEVQVENNKGKLKRSTFNSRGLLLFTEEAGIGDDNQLVTAKLGFCYNPAGQLIKKADLNGTQLSCSGIGASVPSRDESGNNLTFWSYDGFGRLTAHSDPDQGVTRSQYNSFGETISATDALNRTFSMSYDRLGRLTAKVRPNGEGTVYYKYDERSGSQNALGRLVELDDPVQTKTFSYDKLGRLQAESRVIKEHTSPETNVIYTTRYSYDLMHRTLAVDYPSAPGESSGLRACYGYNRRGYINKLQVRLKAETGSGCGSEKSLVENITYNELGSTETIEYGNGVNSQYFYDIKGRMTRLLSSRGNKKLQDSIYTFDTENSIKAVQNNATDYQTAYNYQYDGLNRLVSANGSYVESPDGTGTSQTTPSKYQRGYGYALNGNLSRKDFYNTDNGSLEDRWTYNYRNHQVTSIDSSKTGANRFQLSYDAVGNMTSKTDGKSNKTKNIIFDAYNRIREVRNPTSGEVMGDYWYDDQGFRVRKIARYETQNGMRETEIIYPSKFFGLEKGADLNVVNNIYLNGLRIAAVTPSGGAVYFMGDQVDSVKMVVSDAGETVTRTEYMPYGETFVQKGDTDFAPKFNSQELDRESGFYFYNARYYDPEISRFVTADSIIDGAGTTQGWNRYMYVKGNPVRYKDPTGHDSVGGTLGAGGTSTPGLGSSGVSGMGLDTMTVANAMLSDSGGAENASSPTVVPDGKAGGSGPPPVSDQESFARWAKKNYANDPTMQLAADKLISHAKTERANMRYSLLRSIRDLFTGAASFFVTLPGDMAHHADLNNRGKPTPSQNLQVVLRRAMAEPGNEELFDLSYENGQKAAAYTLAARGAMRRGGGLGRSNSPAYRARIARNEARLRGPDFIVSESGTAVHATQSLLKSSIRKAGGISKGKTSQTSEIGEIFELNTSHGPMSIRIMPGKAGGGPHSTPRTITTRPGTNDYIYPSGKRVSGNATKAQRRELGHIHGQHQ